MKNRRKLTFLATSLALTTFITTGQMVNAQNYHSSDAPGQERRSMWNSAEIDSRIASLRNQVNVAFDSGRISTSVKSGLLDDLNDILARKHQLDDNGFTRGELAELDHSLDAIADRVRLASGPFGQPSGVTFNSAELDSRLASLRAQINGAFNDGTISVAAKAELMANLNDIQSRKLQLDDNGFTRGELIELNQSLDALTERVRVAVAVVTPPNVLSAASLDRMRVKLWQDINFCRNRGTITQFEARALKQEFSELAARANGLGESGWRMRRQEAARIQMALDNLKRRVAIKVSRARTASVFDNQLY